MVVHERDPFNAEPPRSALLRGATTAPEDFYVRSHGPVPELDPNTWRLRVDGLLEHELELSLGELRARFSPTEVLATLQCAGNRRAGLIAVREIPGEAPWGPGATATATWQGVRLADVLAHAGLREDAAHVAFLGADTSPQADPPQPFGASIPRRKAIGPEVLLAWGMNGQPLPAVHGAPLRVVVPGFIGARSVKWLERITAQAAPSQNYFQAMSYRLLPPDSAPERADAGDGVTLGAIALNSDILAPEEDEAVPPGRLEVRGYAFAGDDRRIVRVDLSTDAGRTWQQAGFLDEQSDWAWRRWRGEVQVEPGRVEIVARAWDSSAASQPEHAASLWNPKGYVNNAWGRVSVRVGH